MKLLVATHQTQGDAAGDYCWTIDGELAAVNVLDCDDRQCGCSRGFVGLASTGATTTAMVLDLPGVTDADLRDAVTDWLDRSGWLGLADSSDDEELIDDVIAEIHSVCRWFAVGTVVRREGGELYEVLRPVA